jgi:hypothetical protein
MKASLTLLFFYICLHTTNQTRKWEWDIAYLIFLDIISSRANFRDPSLFSKLRVASTLLLLGVFVYYRLTQTDESCLAMIIEKTFYVLQETWSKYSNLEHIAYFIISSARIIRNKFL